MDLETQPGFLDPTPTPRDSPLFQAGKGKLVSIETGYGKSRGCPAVRPSSSPLTALIFPASWYSRHTQSPTDFPDEAIGKVSGWSQTAFDSRDIESRRA